MGEALKRAAGEEQPLRLQMAQAWWTEGGDRVVRQEVQMGEGETEMATFNLGEADSIDISLSSVDRRF